jgi:hypothetical protein
MGGYGSTRWGGYNKRNAVEDGLTLSIKPFKEALAKGPGHSGIITWSRGDVKTASIAYTTEQLGEVLFLRLEYKKNGEPQDYVVPVTFTTTPRGGRQWFFNCPMIRNGETCLHRVAKLYLPPRAAAFGCRECYGLTYTSCQESHRFDKLFSNLAADMGGRATPGTLKRLLKNKGGF